MLNAMDGSITASFDKPYFSSFTALEKLDVTKIKHGITFNTEILPEALKYFRAERSTISQFPNFSVAPAGIETLDLDDNYLTYIPREHIAALSKLRVLEMRQNALKSIPDISSMAQLQTLDVRNNQLITMPDLYGHNLTDLKIADNPFECNQSLCWIRMWPWMKSPMLESNPECAFPIDVQGIALMELSPTYLQCYNGMLNQDLSIDT